MERQTHLVGDLEAGRLAGVKRLHEQLLDLIDTDAGVLQALRFREVEEVRAHFDAIGTRTWTNLMAAGPMVTTQIAGKMQNTSGNTIFTPVLAAASSARWRRLVRSVSEWTRSERATLVPNLSVWISIAASDDRSSTPVRSARLRSASERPLPARSSRLISRSSAESSGCANDSSSPTR